MDIKRNTNKPACIITLIIIGILAAVVLVLGIHSRQEMVKKSKNYKYTKGTIISYKEYEHEDDDDDNYYTYSYTISYRANLNTYQVTTDDIFRRVPYTNETISIMYNLENPEQYYTAKKDRLSGLYFPSDYNGYGFFLTFFLCLSFFIIIIAFLVPPGNLVNICLGLGFLLLGLTGLIFAFIMETYSLIVLMIFGVLGLFILYRVIFISKEKRIQDATYTEYARLFLVHDIIFDMPDIDSPVVLFQQAWDSGVCYYSYVDVSRKFNMGEKYQLDIRLITDDTDKRQIKNITAIDISYIPNNEFKPLNHFLDTVLSKTIDS